MSSFENFNIDFSHLSFDLPKPTIDLKNDRQEISQSRQGYKCPPMAPRTKSRNKQCMPSDDEEDEEEGQDDDDSDSDCEKVSRGAQTLAVSMTKPIRKSRPLPSDDEDSEDEEQGEDSKSSFAGENKLHPGNRAYQEYANPAHYHSTACDDGVDGVDGDDDDDDRALVANPNAGPILTLVEGSHLQQLHYKQQQHQAQLAQFQYQQQHQHLPQQYYHQQQHSKSRGNVSMSGMDLLKQLEQEKADSKRIKPKLDPSKVKIEGLLGKLPEPGSHNINFQQIQQQQHHQRKNNQYLDPSTFDKARSCSPSKNTNYRVKNSTHK